MTSEYTQHASTQLKTIYGQSILHCYNFGSHEEDNLLCIAAGDFHASRIVRVQSACYTAEIFRSTDCDCHEQLHTSLTRIHLEGGLLIYMIADGRGAGLLTKVRGLALGQTDGLDTFDAYEALGVSPDPRSYENVAYVLKDLGLSNVLLLTNNPRKVEGLRAGGLDVEREALEIQATADSSAYLRSKRDRFGHLLDHLDGD